MSDRTSALTTSSTAADTRFADEMLRRARALDASLAAGKASAVPASRPAVRTLARPAGGRRHPVRGRGAAPGPRGSLTAAAHRPLLLP